MVVVNGMGPLPNAAAHRGIVSCAGCLFYRERAGVLEKVGECRRYPPVLLLEPGYRSPKHWHPNVTPRDWCGEFTPRELAARPKPRPLLSRIRRRLTLLLDPFAARF